MIQAFIIGQSPRPAILAELCAAAPGAAFTVTGALDGLTRAEIDRLTPTSDADALFTVLPGGDTVTLSKQAVARHLRPRLPTHGTALLCCTGTFAGVPASPRIIQPSAVLGALAHALLPAGTLGLFVPIAEQVEPLAAERARPGVRAVAVTLRPGSDPGAIDVAARQMAAHAPGLVIMDCISYTGAERALVAAHLPCPVLLSIAVAAQVAAQVAAGSQH